MNEYTRHTLVRFHRSFFERTFDQDDVALFIVLARDYTKKGSIFRELGDFLAHPESKDRGIVLESVRNAAEAFERDFRKLRTDRDFKWPAFTGLGTLEDILAELKDVFELAGLTEHQFGKESASFRDFVFCIIFLLSACKIKLDGKLYELEVEYSHALSLKLRYENKNHPRHFVVMPVVMLLNVWIDCPTILMPTKYVLSTHIARRLVGGMLAAISHKDDDSDQPKTGEALGKGKVWPLPLPTWPDTQAAPAPTAATRNRSPRSDKQA
jgi:hypothetical protein